MNRPINEGVSSALARIFPRSPLWEVEKTLGAKITLYRQDFASELLCVETICIGTTCIETSCIETIYN